MCCENGNDNSVPGVRSIHSPPSEASARLGRLRVKSGSRVRALNGDVLKKRANGNYNSVQALGPSIHRRVSVCSPGSSRG